MTTVARAAVEASLLLVHIMPWIVASRTLRGACVTFGLVWIGCTVVQPMYCSGVSAMLLLLVAIKDVPAVIVIGFHSRHRPIGSVDFSDL